MLDPLSKSLSPTPLLGKQVADAGRTGAVSCKQALPVSPRPTFGYSISTHESIQKGPINMQGLASGEGCELAHGHLTTRSRLQERAIRPSTLLAIFSKYSPKLDGISLYTPSAGVKGEKMCGRPDADTTYGLPSADWASLRNHRALNFQRSAESVEFVVWPHRRRVLNICSLEPRVLPDSPSSDSTYVSADTGRRTKPEMGVNVGFYSAVLGEGSSPRLL